jgi:hypothetical protein
VLAVLEITISDYQGISNVGFLGIHGYYNAIQNTWTALRTFYVGREDINVYRILNALFFIFLAYIFLKTIVFEKKDSLPIYKKIIIFLLLISCIFIAYAYFFVSPNVFYHSLMMIGLYFVYFFCIILLDKNSNLQKWTRRASIFVLFLLCVYNLVNTNIAYAKMQMSYEKSYYAASEILYKIDSIAPKNNNKIIITGSLPQTDNGIKLCPEIIGVSDNVFLVTEDHFRQFYRYYFNRNFDIVDNEMKNKILNSEEFKTMDVYPYGKCVKIIDGIIVVKLSQN